MSEKSDKLDIVVKDEFHTHCKENDKRFNSIDTKLNSIMGLADLVPTLKEIVNEKKAMTFIGSKVLKIITVLGVIVGVIYTIYKIVTDIRWR